MTFGSWTEFIYWYWMPLLDRSGGGDTSRVVMQAASTTYSATKHVVEVCGHHVTGDVSASLIRPMPPVVASGFVLATGLLPVANPRKCVPRRRVRV
jgi:hypothetical protein